MPEQTMTAGASLPVRIRRAMRYWTNWLQFGRYAAVGILGWIISIGTFALFVHVFGTSTLVAATCAFCLALTNNFLWNRHWTFRARDGHAGFQATRFVVINIGAFLFSLVVLRFCIDVLGLAPVVSQSIAVLMAAPPNFVAHRIWSFRI